MEPVSFRVSFNVSDPSKESIQLDKLDDNVDINKQCLSVFPNWTRNFEMTLIRTAGWVEHHVTTPVLVPRFSMEAFHEMPFINLS